jgi:hypothetical protein
MRTLSFFWTFTPIILAVQLHAQETSKPSTALVEVVHQHTLTRADGGTTTFKRITAPPPKEAVVSTVTVEETAEMQRRRSMKHTFLAVAAARFTEGSKIQWQVPDMQGERMEGTSNVDFEILRDTGAFEWEGVWYTLVLSMDAPEAIFARHVTPTTPVAYSATFVVTDQPSGAGTEEALRAMAALHAYFEQNKAAISANHDRLQAERDEAARIKKAQTPPGPPHTVIEFWPVRTGVRSAGPLSPSTGGADKP